ncbi:MAG: S1 RNA-binding domain-containing protein, partial [Rhodospirillaceae bacterium]|nr:S1 RNA-binding domain-containing protein [Rhodospirillaceae bacterium]
MPEGFAPDEIFADLLDETFGANTSIEGSVITGRVIQISNDMVLVDVGLKAEGNIPLKEFATPGEDVILKPGDSVDVFVE